MAASVIAKRGVADGGVVRADVAKERTSTDGRVNLPLKALLTVKSAPEPMAVFT